MAAGEKISLLIMRDNGAARRLRMRRSLLISLFVFLGVSPFVAAASIWFSADLWSRYQTLLRQTGNMEQEYREAKAIAARLSNLEKLLQYRDAAEEAQILQNLQRSGAADAAEVASAPPMGADSGDGPGHGEFPTINTGFVSVENVSVRLLSGNKLRISLDISNPDSRKSISGKVSCVLTTAGGDTVPLETTPPAAGDFRISRLKRTVLAATLPPGVDAANAQTVIEVRSDGGGLEFRNVYPVAK